MYCLAFYFDLLLSICIVVVVMFLGAYKNEMISPEKINVVYKSSIQDKSHQVNIETILAQQNKTQIHTYYILYARNNTLITIRSSKVIGLLCNNSKWSGSMMDIALCCIPIDKEQESVHINITTYIMYQPNTIKN